MSLNVDRIQKETHSRFLNAAGLALLVLALAAGSACGPDQSSPGTTEAQAGAKGKIIFYRNPMDPKITSPTPMKDGMGMDYIPVYENEVKQP